ncbi:MAG: AI-2E family transporter [Gammaproteobacteria bacterium]|nr:MAG: AI-2E family transporter [Gammaproteobacteria bacterium]
MNIIVAWFRRILSDPQAVILGVILLVGFAIIFFLGHALAPVIAAVVIAYLLEGVVNFLERWHVPRLAAVLIVFSTFMVFFIYALGVLLPLLSQQLTQFIRELPNMIAQGQELLMRLPERYPEFVSEALMRELIAAIRAQVGAWGQEVLTRSLAFIPDLITLTVYLFLVPLLVFFFLKDKDLMVTWLSEFLPRERTLARRVWHEVNEQISNYIRGKFVEIIIVALASYIAFTYMGLNYAMLLAVLVGLSVIVPYIGALVVTIPVAMVAYFQWGWGSDFAYTLGIYILIQVIDGNLLVPLIFSEAVNLHPVAIIVAVLVFGELWGFWGVFFAIPLATLVKAVISAWPRASQEMAEEAPEAMQTAPS